MRHTVKKSLAALALKKPLLSRRRCNYLCSVGHPYIRYSAIHKLWQFGKVIEWVEHALAQVLDGHVKPGILQWGLTRAPAGGAQA